MSTIAKSVRCWIAQRDDLATGPGKDCRDGEFIENIDDEGLLPELPGSNCCNQTFTLKIDIRKSGSDRLTR